jgi:hypothetical protein
MIEINDRIAFIEKLDTAKKLCYFIDYGKYLGKVKVTKEISEIIPVKKRLQKLSIGKEVCYFILDNGNIVYQWSGWWVSENRFKEIFIDDCYKEGWKIVNVEIRKEV